MKSTCQKTQCQVTAVLPFSISHLPGPRLGLNSMARTAQVFPNLKNKTKTDTYTISFCSRTHNHLTHTHTHTEFQTRLVNFLPGWQVSLSVQGPCVYMEMAPLPDLGVIMQYGSGFTDESQPSDGALWLSKHIDPCRRKSMSLQCHCVTV